MNFYERRRRILQLLRMRPRPRCSMSELVSMVTGTASNPGMVTGRGSSECEIHIDGNMFFWIAGLAGAGLAFLTYQAITMGRRRRRDTDSGHGWIADMLWLGRNTHWISGISTSTHHPTQKLHRSILHVIVAQRIFLVCHMKDFSVK